MPGATFDVIVVGAGIAGLAASIALTEKGHRVTVLDAAPAVSELKPASLEQSKLTHSSYRRLGRVSKFLQTR